MAETETQVGKCMSGIRCGAGQQGASETYMRTLTDTGRSLTTGKEEEGEREIRETAMQW